MPWTNAASDGKWSTAGNWTNNSTPSQAGQIASFGPALVGTVTVDTPQTIGGMIFSNSGAGYTISGSNALTLAGTGSNPAATVTVTSGSDTISAPLALSGATVFAGSGSLTVSGSVLGTGGSLAVSGNGQLNLSGVGSYAGSTMVNGGTLQLGIGGATGSLSPGSVITDNGALVFSRSNSVTQGTDFSSATISGSGSLTQAGGGTLVLNAANTYTGGTTVSAGVLVAGGVNALSGSSALTVSGGTLDASGFVNSVASLNIGSSGSLNLGLGNTLTSSGPAAFNGTLDISGTGSLGNYRLLTYSSENGAFAAATGLGSNYGLLYSATELDALHKAQVGTLTVTAVNPTIIVGGETNLIVSLNNSAPSLSDTLILTASAGGNGYGLSTTGSLAAASSGNFTITNGFNGTSLSPGSYTAAVTLTGTNNALGGLALNSGGTATVAISVLDHSAGSAVVIAGNGFLAHAGATGLSALIMVSNTAGTRSDLQVNAAPAISSGTLGSGPATPYYLSAGSAQAYTVAFNAGSAQRVCRFRHVRLRWRQPVAAGRQLAGLARAFDYRQCLFRQGRMEGRSRLLGTGCQLDGYGRWRTIRRPGVLGYATDTATFGAALPSGSAAVTLDSAAPLLSNLIFSNSNASYVILQGTGTTALTLTGTGGSSPAAMTVSLGTHWMETPIVLDSNLVVSSSGRLTLGGDISDGGLARSLTLNGGGELILAGTGSYTGGTTVDNGTLYLISPTAIAAGTNLTVAAGGTFLYDPSTAAAPLAASPQAVVAAAVPEPGTLALLAAVGMAGAAIWLRRRVTRPITGLPGGQIAG